MSATAAVTPFQLEADDDAPSWVTEAPVIYLAEGGWEPDEVRQGNERVPWTRQQKRIYQRAQTVLQRHEHQGHQGLWVMLSSSDRSNPDRIAAHHAELRRLVLRDHGYGGKLHHFTVRTAEGVGVDPSHRGVLHVLWFYEPAPGEAHRYFQVPQRWLSATWERLHGASYVWVARYRPGPTSRRRVSRYVIAQYVGDQNALVRYSWSWRITFSIGIVAFWKRFRNAHGGTMREITTSWSRLLAGETIDVHGQPFALPLPSS